MLNLSEILDGGFFPESFPKDIFRSKGIIKYINEETIQKIELKMRDLGIKGTPCILYSTKKSTHERRILGIPHIESYLLLIDEIEKTKEIIEEKINKNSYSQSKNIKSFMIVDYEDKNWGNKKNTFEAHHKQRIRESLGHRYMLYADLSKCYENIYTHSISWALLGKEEAKNQHLKGKDSSEEYRRADKLDEKIRFINNNETKGIPTGPITSRVISELILGEIDQGINMKFPEVKFSRYVDDYKFFFKTKAQAEKFIPDFQKILYEYKQHLNSEKLKIVEFPYDIPSDLQNILSKESLDKNGALNYLYRAFECQNNGSKGAIKYALKVMENFEIKTDEKEITSLLINTLLINPNLANLICKIFFKNKLIEILTDTEKDILNDVLEDEIEKEHNEEVLWLLYFAMKSNIKIRKEILLKILEKMETFSTIMVLDYIQNKRLNGDPDIRGKKEELKKYLQQEDIYQDKWLLIYESNVNGWIKGIKEKPGLNKSEFLKDLFDKKFSFYQSPI